MAFEPLKINAAERRGKLSLTIDSQSRLTVSRPAQRELNIKPYQYVVISVDVENKRIGVAKQELAKVPNATAIKMDKRGYLGASAGRSVCEKLGLPHEELPVKFHDIGWIDENGSRWRAFELSE